METPTKESKDFSKEVMEELEKSLVREFQLIDQLFVFALKILRLCENSDRTKSNKYSFHISLMIYIRAYNSALASNVLIRNGYSFHAGMICRSLFDDLLNLKYLNLGDAEAKAKRYVEFRKLRTARTIKRFKGFKGEKGVSKILEDHLEATKTLYKQKYPDGKWDSDWSGITDSDKAKAVGLEKHYFIVSAQLSNYIHGSPEGIDDAMKGTEDGKHQFWIGPRTDLTLEVMSVVTQYLLMNIEEMVKKFTLVEANEELDRVSKKWKELFTGNRKKQK